MLVNVIVYSIFADVLPQSNIDVPSAASAATPRTRAPRLAAPPLQRIDTRPESLPLWAWAEARVSDHDEGWEQSS